MYGIETTSLTYLYHLAYDNVKEIFKTIEIATYFIRKSLKSSH